MVCPRPAVGVQEGVPVQLKILTHGEGLEGPLTALAALAMGGGKLHVVSAVALEAGANCLGCGNKHIVKMDINTLQL